MAAPWRWMLLGRVLRVGPGVMGSDADFSFPFAEPPSVTVVTATPRVHPDPRYSDRHPYVLVANRAGLLVHFSVPPFHGVQLDVPPQESKLVLVRNFDQAWPGPPGEVFTATAEYLPMRDRGVEELTIVNIESIALGFVSSVDEDGIVIDDTVVAELVVTTGSERARIIYCFADAPYWFQESVDNPLAAHHRDWESSGVVFHDDRFWWFDLSWGILSSSANPDEMNGELLFDELPEGRALDMTLPNIHDHRCITPSRNALRYLEIITEDGEAAPKVAMWTVIPVAADDDDRDCTIEWEMMYVVSFEEIWNDCSYVATKLPRRVSVITAVCPKNPNLVLFSLEQERRLFGVVVPQHKVVKFVDEPYDLVMPWPEPPSSRYVLAWLPQSTNAESEDTTDGSEEWIAGVLNSGSD